MNLLALTTDPTFQEFDREQDRMFDQLNQQQDQAQDFFLLSSGFIVVVGVLGLLYTVFWVWTLIDAATTPEQAWRDVGQSKLLWIVVMVVLGAASIVYVFWPRPQLRAASGRGRASRSYAGSSV